MEIGEKVGMPVSDLDSSKKSISPWRECVRETGTDGRQERERKGKGSS